MGHEAMELGAERAKRNGVCVVGLSNSHHIGRIGHWAEQCIGHGLVSIHFVNVLARPIVAPFGGRDARHGTNPFASASRGREKTLSCWISPPADRPGQDPRGLQQGRATGSRHHHRQPRQPVDRSAFTVIEPSGAILPFGEHKGSGLALICELLGGALSGGKTLSGKLDAGRRVLNGMFSILIDPGKMGPARTWRARWKASSPGTPPRRPPKAWTM